MDISMYADFSSLLCNLCNERSMSTENYSRDEKCWYGIIFLKRSYYYA